MRRLFGQNLPVFYTHRKLREKLRQLNAREINHRPLERSLIFSCSGPTTNPAEAREQAVIPFGPGNEPFSLFELQQNFSEGLCHSTWREGQCGA